MYSAVYTCSLTSCRRVRTCLILCCYLIYNRRPRRSFEIFVNISFCLIDRLKFRLNLISKLDGMVWLFFFLSLLLLWMCIKRRHKNEKNRVFIIVFFSTRLWWWNFLKLKILLLALFNKGEEKKSIFKIEIEIFLLLDFSWVCKMIIIIEYESNNHSVLSVFFFVNNFLNYVHLCTVPVYSPSTRSLASFFVILFLVEWGIGEEGEKVTWNLMVFPRDMRIKLCLWYYFITSRSYLKKCQIRMLYDELLRVWVRNSRREL